jgi:hypothetical protein
MSQDKIHTDCDMVESSSEKTARERSRLLIILDDCPRRKRKMQRQLDRHFTLLQAVYFDDAQQMIGYLKANLQNVHLISLDHDLAIEVNAEGKLVDFGTGREVADHLAQQSPCCPIIIHSSNATAAVGMQLILKDAGWRVYRAAPYGDLEWIPACWHRAIRKALNYVQRPQVHDHESE